VVYECKYHRELHEKAYFSVSELFKFKLELSKDVQ